MKRAFSVILFLLLATGCAAPLTGFRSSPQGIKNISCVAVLPFENLSQNGSAGQIVSDIVSMKVMAIGDFSVMTRAEVQDMLESRGIRFTTGIPVSAAPEIGKILGVQAVFAGTVTNYPAGRDAPGDAAAFKMYFIDVPTGNVLWTGSGDFERASAPDGETIPAATVVQDGVSRLLDQFHSSVRNSSGSSDVVCWNDPDRTLARLVMDRHAAATASVPGTAAAASAQSGTTLTAAIPPANVSIINASGIPKLEIKMGILLVKNKFNVSNVITGKKRIPTTTIYYHRTYYAQAVAIAKLLSIRPALVQSDSYNWDITLFIGRDMR